MPLNISDETGDIVFLENGIVVPPDSTNKTRHQKSGVLDESGAFVENSISWDDSENFVNAAPDQPAAETLETLPGTWMFGGIVYGHFGHFIVESMARIWALAELGEKIDGIVFTPKVVGERPNRALTVYADLLKAFGVDVPTKLIVAPTQVEKLYVPRQGFGTRDLITGSRKFREWMTTRAGQNVPADGAERIYISRTKLPPMRGGLIGERVLEAYLAAEGYHMFHPQLETQNSQIAQYKAARDVISVDCSPLHLVGYVGDKGQRVAIVTRRSMSIAQNMVEQLNTFTGANAFEVNALIRDWVPGNSHRAGRSSFGEIDFPATWAALKQHGMISAETPWPPLTEEQRAEDLARIEELHKIKFNPLEIQPQPQPQPAEDSEASS